MTFTGWPERALDFYEGLEADNSKTYWTAHKATYETDVLAPMQELLAELSPRWGEPKIFRPYRDVRFAKDKTPYKTAIAAVLDGERYVQFSAAGLFLGAGRWHMDSAELDSFRRAVAHDLTGAQLVKVLAAAEKKGLSVGSHGELKTVPRGYDRDHPRADLLRRKGITVGRSWGPEPWLSTREVPKRINAFFTDAQPFQAWLTKHVTV